MNYYDEITVIHAVAAGNQQAFRQLFYHYKDRVNTVALRYTQDRLIAEEVVQDSFVRIWKNRQKLAGIENFPAWLYRIVINLSLTALQKMALEGKRKEELLSWNPAETPFGATLSDDYQLKELLKQALERLSPQQRKIFQLSRIQGISRAEIAEKLGISQATVSVHLTIALRVVRAFLVSRLDLVLWALLLLH